MNSNRSIITKRWDTIRINASVAVRDKIWGSARHDINHRLLEIVANRVHGRVKEPVETAIYWRVWT